MAETKKKTTSTSAPKPKQKANSAKGSAARNSTAKSAVKSAAPKSKAAAPAPKEPSRFGKVLSQIAPYLLFLLGVFLIICFITYKEGSKTNPGTGVIGNWLCTVSFGLFSGAAYLIPLLTLLFALFWRHDFGFPVGRGERAIWGTLFLLFTAADVHAVAFLKNPALKVFGVDFLWKSGLSRTGGGVLGGWLGSALLTLVGKYGALLLGIAATVIFALFFFGLTPHTVYVWIAFTIHEKREKSRALREEREEREREYEKEHALKQYEKPAKPEKARPSAEPVPVSDPKRKPYVDDAPLGGGAEEETPAESKNEGIREHLKPVIGPKKQFRPVPEEEAAPEEPKKEDTPVLPDPAAFDDTDSSIYAPGFTLNTKDNAAALASQVDEAMKALNADADAPKAVPAKEDRPAAPVKKPAGSDEDIDLEKIFTDPEGNDVIAKFQEEQRLRALDAKIKRDLDGDPIPESGNEAEFELAIRRLSDFTGTAPMADTSGAGKDDAADEAVTEPAEEIPVRKPYQFPPITLMKLDPAPVNEDVSEELHSNGVKLVETLRSFKVRTRIVNISRGPTITRYELTPEEGIRVRQIANLVDDIALNLATSGVRIEAPIPGKSAVGIEVPNKNVATVYLRELIDTTKFRSSPSLITACLGKDVAGEPIYFDIAKMPHLLIAGATGMGKSVCMNSVIVSLLYKASPDDVKLMLIDPKKVEMNIYNGLPHLLVPVVSDPKKAAGALQWAVTEMERRYELIEGMGVRDLKNYNKAIEDDPKKEHLPQIVILIDELADLMMTASDDVETSICRLAQKARAAGMHLIIGTQRPSVDVITGLIKANVPSRIAFTVSQQMDSRVILDMAGAEKLIGRGDMLYAPVGASKPIRVQGAFVSEKEVEEIVAFIKDQGITSYDDGIIESIEKEAARCGNKHGSADAAADAADDGEADNMLKPAIELAIESGKISTSLIQRRLSLGYGRAAKLIDKMEQMGIVSAPEGQKPRTVLISKEQYMEMVLDHSEDLG